MPYQPFFPLHRIQRWGPLIAIGVIVSLFAAPLTAKPGTGGGKPDQGTQTEQRVKWRVPLEGSYSQVRPAVAADGTVYVVDVTDRLYAFAPDGTLLWTVPDAGAKGVSVGADGTVYTGNEDWVKAFNPAGSHEWTFTQTPRAFVLPDVSVGPDGKIYAIASSGLGVFALQDPPSSDIPFWQTEEIYARIMVSYTELAFGPTQDGLDEQLYFFANGHIRALRLSDGADVFTTSGVAGPVVSPFDGSWHQDNTAHNPDGSLLWEFLLPDALAGTVPALDLHGNHYTVVGGYQLFAIDPFGGKLFDTALDENVGPPDVDPTGTVLLMSTQVTSTMPAAVKAVSTTNGRALWRTELPPSDNGANQYVDTGFAFSPSGDTAYVISSLLVADQTQSGSFLYAIALDGAVQPAPSELLRSADILLSAKSKGKQGISVTGAVSVEDENQAPISGATVQAFWTLPDGSTLAAVSESGGGGSASFSVSGEGSGFYQLTVVEITKDGYTFDPQNSQLSATIAAF